MSKIVPSAVGEDRWKKFEAQRDYAIRIDRDAPVFLRLGPRQSYYLKIAFGGSSGYVAMSVDFDTGKEVVVGRIPSGKSLLVGRTSECDVKVMHPLVSREHARMFQDDKILLISDKDSRNGTFVLDDHFVVDLAEYVKSHPPGQGLEATIDVVHEMFGPSLDDFLKRYIEQRNELV